MLLWSGFTTELKHFDVCIYYVQYVNLELFWQTPAEKQATEVGQILASQSTCFEVSGYRWHFPLIFKVL